MSTDTAFTARSDTGSPREVIQEKVVAMTRQLFGGEVTVRVEPDPEVPIDYFVVYAEARGDVEELIKLDYQWHRMLRESIRPDDDRYCLSLVLK